MFEDNYTGQSGSNMSDLNQENTVQETTEQTAETQTTETAEQTAEAQTTQETVETPQTQTYGTYDYNAAAQNTQNSGNAGSGNGKKKNGKAVLAVALAAVLGICAGAGAMGISNAMSKKASVTAATTEQRIGALASADEDGTEAVAATEETASAAEEKTNSIQLSTGETAAVVTDVTEVVKKAMPSIVCVYNNYSQNVNVFGQTYTQEGQAQGSGIIIGETDDELLIVTNNHVVDGEDSLEVQFIDGKNVEANIKGTDSTNDLAVIAVSKDDMESDTLSQIAVAEIGDSDALEVGEPAIAIGNALGYGQSVTAGVISALNRELSTSDDGEEALTFIQTDAAINEGNSGGALLNASGQVIGINSNKLSGSTVEGMGYAIPMARAIPIIENLMNMETKTKVSEDDQGTLGITCTTITSDYSQVYDWPQGVYVLDIVPGGGAENSDLQKKDIITGINGTTVESYDDLTKQLQYYKAGTTVTLTVQRLDNGEWTEKEIELTLGTQESLKNAQSSSSDSSEDSQSQGSQSQDNQNNQNQNGQGTNPFNFRFGF